MRLISGGRKAPICLGTMHLRMLASKLAKACEPASRIIAIMQLHIAPLRNLQQHGKQLGFF